MNMSKQTDNMGQYAGKNVSNTLTDWDKELVWSEAEMNGENLLGNSLGKNYVEGAIIETEANSQIRNRGIC